MDTGAGCGERSPADGAIFGGHILTQNDPTDHALAAIASILEHPESHREPEIHREAEVHREPEAVVVEEKPLAPEMIEAAGYSKVGPGPIAAIRFRWIVRHEADGEYYVDETIGENSAPITTGPMSADAAIQLVDDSEREAQRKFQQLRSEMSGRAAAANLVRNDGGEI
jgi:hypothetical protein